MPERFWRRGRARMAGCGGTQRAGTVRRMSRVLPYVLSPAPGEDLPSFVSRCAADFDVPPGLVVDRLGLPLLRHHRVARPVLGGLFLSADTVLAIAQRTRLPRSSIHAMLGNAYDGTALRLDGLSHTDLQPWRHALPAQWFTVGRTRACPQCLAADGYWRLSWRLGSSFACTTHSCLLVDTCPACRGALKQGYAGRFAGFSRRRRLGTTSCTNWVPAERRVCGWDLSGVASAPVQQPLLKTQDLWYELAEAPRESEQHLSSAEHFQWVRWIIAATRHLAEAPPVISAATDDHSHSDRRRRGGQSGITAAPRSAQAMASATAAALPLLGDLQIDEIVDHAQNLLRQLARSTTTHGSSPLRGMPLPRPVQHLKIQPRGGGRVVVAIPATRAISGIQFTPVLLTPLDAVGLSHFCAPVKLSKLRRLGALSVARLHSARSWQEAGRALGQAPYATRRCDQVRRAIADPVGFWRQIERISDRLQREGVAYGQRRSGLWNFELDHPALRELGWLPTKARQRDATTWLWCDATGGEWCDAPAQQSSDMRIDSRYETFRRFAHSITPEDKQALRKIWKTRVGEKS